MDVTISIINLFGKVLMATIPTGIMEWNVTCCFVISLFSRNPNNDIALALSIY